jgi:hypothetical protein
VQRLERAPRAKLGFVALRQLQRLEGFVARVLLGILQGWCKGTCNRRLAMSALPPIATTERTSRDVSDMPNLDIGKDVSLPSGKVRWDEREGAVLQR